MQKGQIKSEKGCMRSKYWRIIRGAKYNFLFCGGGWFLDLYIDPKSLVEYTMSLCS
jgi:hypothetical protein